MTSDEEPASRPNYVDYLFAERASRAEYFHLALAVLARLQLQTRSASSKSFPVLALTR